MRHVQLMNGIWRMSDHSYRKLLKDIRANIDINLDNYGKLVISQFDDLEDLQEENLAPKWKVDGGLR